MTFSRVLAVLASLVLSGVMAWTPAEAVGKVVGPGCYFTWDANTETDLEGYKLYLGPTTGSYGTPVDVGNVTTFTCLAAGVENSEGQYFVAVTAYDLAGNESGFSNEVPFAFDANAPSAPIGAGVEKK